MNDWLKKAENSAIDVIAVFAPWLGPIPSAYLVGRACIAYLDWHWSVAWIAAVAVESIGVVSVVLSLKLYEWNDTKNKTDPAAPFKLSLLLVMTYFVVTIGLTVLLDVFPNLARFAPAIFPLLAAVGAVNIAVKNGQQRREQVKEQEKLSRKAERKEKVSESKAKVSPEIINIPPKVSDLTGNALMVYSALQENPGATNTSIAENLNITRQRVGQIRKELNGRVKQ